MRDTAAISTSVSLGVFPRLSLYLYKVGIRRSLSHLNMWSIAYEVFEGAITVPNDSSTGPSTEPCDRD